MVPRSVSAIIQRKDIGSAAADGIKLDVDNFPEVNDFTAKEDYIGEINYSDFALTFEPFDTIPTTFDFIEGDVQGAFVIRNVSVE